MEKTTGQTTLPKTHKYPFNTRISLSSVIIDPKLVGHVQKCESNALQMFKRHAFTKYVENSAEIILVQRSPEERECFGPLFFSFFFFFLQVCAFPTFKKKKVEKIHFHKVASFEVKSLHFHYI